MVFGTPPWPQPLAQARPSDADPRAQRPSLLLPEVSNDSFAELQPKSHSPVAMYAAKSLSPVAIYDKSPSYSPNPVPTVVELEMVRYQLELEKIKLEQLKVEAQARYERALQTIAPTSECAYEQAESFRPRSPTTSDKELLSQQLELARVQLKLE